MKFKFFLLIVFSLFCFSHLSFSQKKKEKIKIISNGGGPLERVLRNGDYVEKLAGVKSDVIFKQGNKLYYCREAYWNKKKRELEAIGNVKILSDSITITGNHLFYADNTKVAKMRGSVVLIDPKFTLTTDNLDYNLGNNTGTYFNGGKLVDSDNTLTSKNGYYDKVQHYVHFTNDVKLKGKEATLYANDLNYDLDSKIAVTQGRTVVINQSGEKSISESLRYDTNTKIANFTKQVGITEEYVLTGVNNRMDDLNKRSKADIDVSLTIRKDSITILGDHGTYDKKEGIGRVWGNVLVLNKMGQDTMYMTADTLVAIDEEDDAKDKLLAYSNVKIWKNDLQGKCDSLVYNTGDSTIFLYDDPVLWAAGSQLKSDSIHLELVNKKLHKMFMKSNSFAISEDSIHNFNQLKGRGMVASFKDSKVKKIDINGNAESIYFMLDDKDSVLMGMNKMTSSNMVIRFGEQNKIDRVSALVTPDGVFIPPHEIEEPQRRLKGFKWRITEKPEKKQLTSVRRNLKAVKLPD